MKIRIRSGSDNVFSDSSPWSDRVKTTFCRILRMLWTDQTKLGGWVGWVMRTSWLNFSSVPNRDPADQWDTKGKLISLVEVCAPPSALPVTFTTESEGGYVFTPFCFFVCWILQKVEDEFRQNFVDRLGVWYGRTDLILVKIRIPLREILIDSSPLRDWAKNDT